MAALCVDKSAKYVDGGLHDDLISAPSGVRTGAPASSPGGLSKWVLVWVTLNTLVAVAALIMASWSTHNVHIISNSAETLAGLSSTSALLTSSAHSNLPGHTLAGNMFAGTGYWFAAPPMVYARSDHATVAYGSFIYIFGGVTNQTGANATAVGDPLVLAAVTRYYTPNGRTYAASPMPEPRYRFGYGVINDTNGNQLIYIFGGYNTFNIPYPDTSTAPVASTMMYNFSSDTWKMLPATSNLNSARSDLIGAGISGKLYAAGGWDASYRYPFASVEELDPSTGVWKYVANLTVPRGDAKSAVLDGKFYVMGGVSHDEIAGLDCGGNDYYVCNPFTAAVEAYDPTTGQWTRRSDMNYARGDFAAEALPNGRILTAGGETGNGTSGTGHNQFATHYVEIYLASDDAWVVKAPLPDSRFRYDMAHVGDLVYVCGGAFSCDDNLDTEYCYNENSDSIMAFFDIQYPSLWAFTKS